MNERVFKIMVVDDEADIVDVMSDYLTAEGYRVIKAHNGVAALEKVQSESPDLVLLDVMMPGLDGFEVCKRIRAASPIPVVMVTAKGSDIDTVVGLEIGADDYIVKPFNPRELIARVKAVLRRTYAREYQSHDDAQTLRHKELCIDVARRRVTIRGRALELTLKEFDLLLFLMRNAGRVYSRDSLLDHVWGQDSFVGARTVDVHIRRLREQIETDASQPEYIKTVWGVGYKFSDE